MADDLDLTPEEQKKAQEAEAMFDKMAEQLPARKVKVPEMAGRNKSLSEVEDDEGSPSDLQATLKRLFPSFPENILNRICKSIMVGRVLHDTMLDRVHLTVDDIVMNWDAEEDGQLHFMYILNVVTTAFEIGLDSKGREDAIQLHGVAHETEELEKLADRVG